MAIGLHVVVICLESIVDEKERKNVKENILTLSKKKIIEISLEQMADFAGNMLQMKTKQEGKLVWIMSERANKCLTLQQRNELQFDGSEIVTLEIKTIEDYGGGSARCMLAEIFLSE
jgi:hypothetical protein